MHLPMGCIKRLERRGLLMKDPSLEGQASAATSIETNDLSELSRNLLAAFDGALRTWSQIVSESNSMSGAYSPMSEAVMAAQTFSNVFKAWSAQPEKLAQVQADLGKSYYALFEQFVNRASGLPSQAVAEPGASDNRFRDPEWSSNAYFDFLKQAYLITTNWLEKVVADTDGLSPHQRRKAEFYTRLFSSAVAPSNFPFFNPEVIRETLATNARNLVQGVANFVSDFETSGKISQTDVDAFEVGENLAISPGKVIFQNDVIQLIQYAPTTSSVHEVPLLVVPPWINKFYILDLTPAKSFVKHALDNGVSVFLISWVNPDARLAHKTFGDYVTEGVLAATDVVRRETGVDQINVLGYCVGGTLTATTLAYLAAKGKQPFNSASLLTTQVDFTNAGDLLVFTDDEHLKAVDQMMSDRGFLDGARMANVFNMMRPRDLIWPYVINNYLMGRKPSAFDLLYWNQDSTRMASANHSFYLREYYLKNNLARGELLLGGERLDLAKVKLPIYELAARDDHIAPAFSVYKGARLFGGDVEFVLAASGHTAGVVNPPEKLKYCFWTGADIKPESLNDWLTSAREWPGSWWPHWIAWLRERSGEQVSARKPASIHEALEDAPGSYVRMKG